MNDETAAQMASMFGVLVPEPVQMFRVLIETNEQLAAETAADDPRGGSGSDVLSRFERVEPNHYHATYDGNAIVQCLPQCHTTTHGFELLATIDGSDSTFICNLEHGIFSWMGPASDGGYIGSDVPAFVSLVVSGAAGRVLVSVTQDQSIGMDLTIRPDQDVRISGDQALARAPSWGTGGFTIQERGLLSLAYVRVDSTLLLAGNTSGTLRLDGVEFGSFGCVTVEGNGLVLASIVPPVCVADCLWSDRALRDGSVHKRRCCCVHRL